jgi:hypothetical protein
LSLARLQKRHNGGLVAAQFPKTHVYAYYRDYEITMLQRKPEALCDMLALEFEATGVASKAGQTKTETLDNAQTCDAYHEMYAFWDKLGEKMGGMLQLDSDYTIDGISISPDGKTATIEMHSSLDVGGAIMNLRSRSTDTLICRNGKVLMLHSEGMSKSTSGY